MSNESQRAAVSARGWRPFGEATPRAFAAAMALAAVGALGALPTTRGEPDPLALLVWLALWAPAAGALCASFAIRLWPLGLAISAVWMLLLVLTDASSSRDLPTPFYAALAWTGLFGLGFGLGACARRSPWHAAAWVLIVAAMLVALPVAGGLVGQPFPAALGARLLDASPASLLAECSGLDWMRHPGIYAAADTASMDPSLRLPYRGSLAGPLVLLLGWVFALAGQSIGRRTSRAPDSERRSSGQPSEE